MMATAPYRLQIFLSDDMRKALRDEAYMTETSMQKLVTKVLFDYLKQRPSGQHLQWEEDA